MQHGYITLDDGIQTVGTNLGTAHKNTHNIQVENWGFNDMCKKKVVWSSSRGFSRKRTGTKTSNPNRRIIYNTKTGTITYTIADNIFGL